MKPSSVRHGARLAWEALRLLHACRRRYGMFGWAMLACAFVAGACLVLARHEQGQGSVDRQQLAARLAENSRAAASAPLAAGPAPGAAGARARLQAFDAQLLDQGAIAFAIQDLLDLGEAEGLVMQRGSYRPQADLAGGFLRYRMSVPVKGPGPAIQRFIKASLRKQGSLALSSVQFKRPRIGSPDIEARIDWILLATIPAVGEAR
jgi:hypothetical protein